MQHKEKGRATGQLFCACLEVRCLFPLMLNNYAPKSTVKGPQFASFFFFFFSFFFQLSLPRSESREGGTRAHAEGKHDPSCRNAERDGCGGPCPTQNFPKTSQSRRLQSRRRNSTQKQNSAVAGTPRCGTCSSLTQKGGKEHAVLPPKAPQLVPLQSDA